MCLCVPSCFSCLALCEPLDSSLPGFSAHGILQARILEWVAISPGIFSTQGSNLGLLSCRKIPCRREWLPTPVFLLGESHGQRSLAGYSPWGHKELDMTEWQTHSFEIICSQRFSFELWFLYHFVKPHSNVYWNSASSRGKQQRDEKR